MRHLHPLGFCPVVLKQGSFTVTEFCRLEGVSTSSFYLWKQRLAIEPPTTAFVPLTVDDDPSPPVEVAFPNGIVIRVPADARSLRTLFALAREASC